MAHEVLPQGLDNAAEPRKRDVHQVRLHFPEVMDLLKLKYC